MKKIILVQIRAFDRERWETFVHKTPEEIHDELTNICNTYVPLQIIDVQEFGWMPLNTLTQFTTDSQ